VAIRFDNQLGPVYPLKYYRQELKRADLARPFSLAQPFIQPKPIQLWWDRLNKGLLFGGLLLGLLAGATGVTVAFILRKRSDPMEVAKQCSVFVTFDTAGESAAGYAAGASASSRANGVVRGFACAVSGTHPPSRSMFSLTAVRIGPR